MNIFIAMMPIFFLEGCSKSINWAPQLDQVTIQDSWLTWKKYYSSQAEKVVSYEAFRKAISQAECEELSANSFLLLNIENQRLNKYGANLHLAKDAYPSYDRPRGEKDIASVEYFLKITDTVSPITVAKFIDKSGKLRLIKLDGVHRLVAAFILQSPIRLYWVDLANVEN